MNKKNFSCKYSLVISFYYQFLINFPTNYLLNANKQLNTKWNNKTMLLEQNITETIIVCVSKGSGGKKDTEKLAELSLL